MPSGFVLALSLSTGVVPADAAKTSINPSLATSSPLDPPPILAADSARDTVPSLLVSDAIAVTGAPLSTLMAYQIIWTSTVITTLYPIRSNPDPRQAMWLTMGM